MTYIPIWQQYGFSSEKEFRKRYPNSPRPKSKATSKGRNRKSHVIPKHEQVNKTGR